MTVDDLVMRIREVFEESISKKTGWGKNEILKELDMSIARASLEAFKDLVKP